ncbi:MAG TPA: peptidylprolyl isomerase [Chthoniobacteraceae bacterium]
MASLTSLFRLAPLAAALAFPGLASSTFANTTPILDEPIASAGSPERVKPEIPCGKALLFPLTATDADGDPLTYTVKSSNPRVHVRVKSGNPTLKVSVNYAGDGAASQPFAGDLYFQLFRDWTPMTTNFIAGFAQAGFYDGLKFHRISDLAEDNDPATTETSFIVQGGDPAGNGTGGPGFRFENEFHPAAIFSGRGQLAMANAGYRTNFTFENNQLVSGDWTATNGSQFFITDGQPRALDFKHTIFGQLTRGWDLLDKMIAVPRNPAPTGQSDPAQDSPKVALTINSATLQPNTQDAVLVLSASGVGNSTITVTVEDGKGGTATRTFTATAVDDEWNSRPFLISPGDAVGPIEKPFRVGVSAVDLEFDYLFRNPQLVGGSESNATIDNNGVITAKPGYTGPLRVGFTVSEFDMTYRGTIDGAGPQTENRTTMIVGIGDKVIAGEPEEIQAVPAASAAGVIVAKFQDADTRGALGDFTAKINWGDGTAVTNGAIVRDTSKPGQALYAVTGTHTYTKPGTYGVVVEVFGSKGARTMIQSTAVVTAAPFKASGMIVDANVPVLTNRAVATFTDANSPGTAADYEADIDWGDGQVSEGKIKATGASFAVVGTHKYLDPEVFSVKVTVRKQGTEQSAVAWSTVRLRGFAAKPHLPPFPQAHLICAWEQDPLRTTKGQGAGAQSSFEGSFLVINPGNKVSPTANLRFWLSKDKVLNKSGVDEDIPMKIGTFPKASIAPLQPGGGVRYVLKLEKGTDLRLKPPKGENGAALNILAELDYSDPIIDHSAVDKVGVFGPINAIIATPSTGLMTSESGTTATFTVRLDKAPTAPVTIVVTSSDTTEGTIEAPAVSSDPADPANTRKLVFDATNFSTPQTVTVKGVDDTTGDGDVDYSVNFAPAVSTDIRYKGMVAPKVTIKNLDNESGIKITSAASLTTTEAGGQAQFSVKLERRPTSTVTIALETSDASEGTVSPATLTFTSVDWNTNQVVTVTGVDDAVVDGNVAYSIVLKPAVSSDASFNGKVGPQVSLTNTDNEPAE